MNETSKRDFFFVANIFRKLTSFWGKKLI